MKSEGAAQSGAGPGVSEAWLPALTLALGLQAWRAALVLVGNGPLPPAAVGGAVLACLAPLPAVLLGRVLGPRRTAALLALLLAIVRALVAILGPSWVALYAYAGGALFMGWAAVWPSAILSRRQALETVFLGLALQLAEIAATDTFDLFWQGGLGPAMVGVLLTLPPLVLASVELGAARGAPWRDSPCALALPFLLGSYVAFLGRPVALADHLATGLPLAFSALAGGTLLGYVVLGAADQIYAALLRRRARPGWWLLWHAVRAALTAPLLLGPWFAGGAWLSVAFGPAAAAANLVPLFQARPVGRHRRLGGWAVGWAWLLAVGGAGLDGGRGWFVALAGLVLLGLATVASFHPERVGDTVDRPLRWPRLGFLLPVVAALWLALGAPARSRPVLLPPGAVRVALVRVDDRPPRALWLLARRGALLAELQPQVVILRGPDEHGHGVIDAAWWLARRLGLPVRPLAPAREVAVLGPVGSLVRLAPGGLREVWATEQTVLAAAAWDRDPDGERLAAAAAATREFARTILAGGSPPTARGESFTPPNGFRDIAPADGDSLLLVSRGINVVSADRPTEGLLTALLEVEP